MLKEILVDGAAIFGCAGAVILALRILIFTYLEVANGYEAWPYFRRTIESLLTYDKKVRQKDERWKKLSNVLLKIGWYAVGLAIIFLVTAEFSSMK